MRAPNASKQKSKKAVSSVVGGIIIFGMIISIGYGYFYSIASSQQYYQKVVKLNNVGAQERQSENLILSTTAAGGSFSVTVENVGPDVNITGYFIINNSTGSNDYYSIPEGHLISQDRSYTFSLGTYVAGEQYLFKFLTQRGNVYTTTYPPPATQLSLQSIASGALGDIYLSFNSYSYYDITDTNCPNQGTQVGTAGLSSGYCLSTGQAAFSIPSGDSYYFAFGITMTNLNSQHANITLDQFVLLYQVLQGPNSKGTYYVWYISSNYTENGQNVLLENYNPVVLQYEVPTTVMFASAGCVTSSESPNLSTCNTLPKAGFERSSCEQTGNSCTSNGGFVSTVFIMTHGWEGVSGTLSYSNTNYGQNLPYVSTLYY